MTMGGWGKAQRAPVRRQLGHAALCPSHPNKDPAAMPLMIFSWIKRNRRAKLLAEPYPQEWIEILERNVPYYPLLDAVEQTRLRNDARIMIAEKNWEGIGIELT